MSVTRKERKELARLLKACRSLSLKREDWPRLTELRRKAKPPLEPTIRKRKEPA